MVRKYRHLRIDVVVAVSLPALRFFLRHGEQLWPAARLVFHGFPGEDMTSVALPPGASGVAARQDIVQTVELARQLQPDARRILVVAGVSEFDRGAERVARTALSTWSGHAAIEFLSGTALARTGRPGGC